MAEKKFDEEAASSERQSGSEKGVIALRILLRVLTSVLTVLLIGVGVFLVLNRNRINLDSIKRYLTYRALETTEEGLGVSFQIGQEKELCYAALNNALILCSENRIQIYSDGGTQYVDTSVSMKQPVINTAGDYAVVYDAGGNDLYLFADRQEIYHYATEGNYALISARVNDHGWLAVVEEASGYKAIVTAYDANQQPLVTERISSQFVMDAAVSADNRQLAILTISQEGSNFVSTLTMYDISDGEKRDERSYSDSAVIDMRWDGSGIWLQQEYGVQRLNQQYNPVANWQNNTLYLQGYSLGGDGFAVEYFSRFRAGSTGQLAAINSSGDVIGTLNVNADILSLTAAGRYIAVLTSAKLTIYTSDFTEYATLPNTTGIQQALMRGDGTAMLVTAETANVYLP